MYGSITIQNLTWLFKWSFQLVLEVFNLISIQSIAACQSFWGSLPSHWPSIWEEEAVPEPICAHTCNIILHLRWPMSSSLLRSSFFSPLQTPQLTFNPLQVDSGAPYGERPAAIIKVSSHTLEGVTILGWSTAARCANERDKVQRGL